MVLKEERCHLVLHFSVALVGTTREFLENDVKLGETIREKRNIEAFWDVSSN